MLALYAVWSALKKIETSAIKSGTAWNMVLRKSGTGIGRLHVVYSIPEPTERAKINNEADHYRIESERLHFRKESRKWGRNRFSSALFRKTNKVGYGPFSEWSG